MGLVRIESSKDYYILTEDGKRFFCRSCLTEKLLKAMSKDARYCCFCQKNIESEYKVRAEGRDVPLQHLFKPIERLSTVEEAGTNYFHEDNVISMKLSQKRRAYQKQELPELLIMEMAHNGKSSRVISAYLERTEGLKISYRTIQRLVSGKRIQPEQLLFSCRVI